MYDGETNITLLHVVSVVLKLSFPNLDLLKVHYSEELNIY